MNPIFVLLVSLAGALALAWLIYKGVKRLDGAMNRALIEAEMREEIRDDEIRRQVAKKLLKEAGIQ